MRAVTILAIHCEKQVGNISVIREFQIFPDTRQLILLTRFTEVTNPPRLASLTTSPKASRISIGYIMDMIRVFYIIFERA